MTGEQTYSVDLSGPVDHLDGDTLLADIEALSGAVHVVTDDPDVLTATVGAIRRRSLRLGELLAAGRSEADLAATLAVGQKAGQQTGARAGWQQGYQAGLVAGRAERKPSAASVVIERDQQGRATAVTEQDPEGRITRRRIEHDADGRLLRVVSAGE